MNVTSPPHTHTPFPCGQEQALVAGAAGVASALHLQVPCVGLLGGAGDLHEGEKDPTLGTDTLAHNGVKLVKGKRKMRKQSLCGPGLRWPGTWLLLSWAQYHLCRRPGFTSGQALGSNHG